MRAEPTMESHSHFKDLLVVFARHKVRFLVVGGYAVMLYTEPRWTKDLDLWVDTAGDNAERVFAALCEFGAPLAGCTVEDFRKEGMVFQMGSPPLRVDILMSLSGVSFDEAWVNRREAELFGVTVGFIGRGDLVRNKRTVGRHIDLHDAESLEESSKI